jgi:cyclic beta-1,2-glucan synthetase
VEDLAITRWREDPTCDCWGSYIFLRDTNSGEVWSAGTQPIGKEPDRYEVVFSEDRARMHRVDNSILTSLEVMVSPEDDAEIRRLSISNHGLRARQIEVTSYLEVVLATPAADLAHPSSPTCSCRPSSYPRFVACWQHVGRARLRIR